MAKVRAWAEEALAAEKVRAGPSVSDARAGGAAIVALHPLTETSPIYPIAKRTMDIVLAALGLLVVAPLLALLVVIIKWQSPGPAFYGHERLTVGGRKFLCWKLRTMKADAAEELKKDHRLWARYVENDYKIPIEEDPRITRLGRFLRRASLDELPQLWNVLVGEMSLVGPRPIIDEELRWYGPFAEELLSVRPGITGEWQIMGRNRISYPDRVLVELGYVRRRSLERDLMLLMRSIPAVIFARGSL